MAENSAPFIRLGDGQNAPILDYSIPESTNLAGKSVIAINIPFNFLNRATQKVLENNKKEKDKKREEIVGRLVNNAALYKSDERTYYASNIKIASDVIKSNLGVTATPLSNAYGFKGSFEIVVPPPATIQPKILFIETFQISNFLGNYGAGRVIKTFSLFPGEKTTIKIKSYTKKTEVQKQSQSILDSVSEESVDDFENTLSSENATNNQELASDLTFSESTSVDVETKVKVAWVSAEANVSVDTASTGEWGTKSTREQLSKAVSNSVDKHSARAASKRDIDIDTSSEETTESGTETTIKRVLENVNVSRTLNLVFRQMVQEFVSVLHLVDVKIALYDGRKGINYPEYSFHELDKFCNDYFRNDPAIRATITNGILGNYYYVFNHLDEPIQFIEKKELPLPQINLPQEIDLPQSVTYWRLRKDLLESPPNRGHIKVPGVILSTKSITMRTEGVVVDAFLGQGEGLDAYSQGLQTETVRELHLKNNLKEREADKLELANQIVKDGNAELADLFSKVNPCCKDGGHNITIEQ